MWIQTKIDAVSVVLIGEFHPIIFTPDWFLKYDILSQEDFNQTKTNIIHPESANFQNQWLTVQVTDHKFSAETQEEPFIRIHDFMLTTFKQHLFHTPLKQLGINRTVHFDAGSEAKRNKIAYALAPREPWGKWGEKINSGEGLKHGGLMHLAMVIRNLDDRSKGEIRMNVQPSSEIDYGVRVDINDHFEVTENDAAIKDSDAIMQTLESHFEASHIQSKEIIEQIMGLVE